MRKFHLSRDQRAAILAGGTPHIAGKGQCPIERGYVHGVTKRLSIRVGKVHTNKDGWWITYTIQDSRHQSMVLRRTPNDATDYDDVREMYAPENFRWDQLPEGDTQADIARAAHDSAYGGGSSALSDAGEGVDQQTLDRYAKKADPTGQQLRAKRMAEPHDAFGLRLERARAEIESFDPGSDPHLQRRKRKALRSLTEKEAA